MLFEISKEMLLEALVRTVPIAEKRSTLPILSHVLVNAVESSLTFTATDLEVGIQMHYNTTISEEGIVAAPARKFLEIVKELPPGVVQVVSEESGRMSITSGESRFKLAAMDPADYPAWANFEEVVFSVVPTATLVRMIEKTLFAASADETRFNLNGVRVETTEGKTLMVATDGHRLAFIEEAISLAGSDHLLIPKKGLLELKRVLEGAEETVSLGFDKKNMFVRTDKFLMTIRLIEGEYPPFRKVIPPESDRRLRADRIRMIQALRRTSVLASERSKLLHIDAQPGMIEFSLRHPDLGEAKDVVSAEYDGEQVKLSVNVFYLLEALTAIDTETVRLEFNPEGKPIVLRPEPTDCYFNLVMPMKL